MDITKGEQPLIVAQLLNELGIEIDTSHTLEQMAEAYALEDFTTNAVKELHRKILQL